MITAKTINVKNQDGEEVDVCIRLERDADGKDFVKISTWHTENQIPQYQEAQMDFGDSKDNFNLCQRFVEDFSESSAKHFAQSFDF